MRVLARRVRLWLCALVLPLAGGVAAAQTAQSSSPQLDMIPVPTRIEARSGEFVLRADATLSHPRDADAARIADYFAQLLLQTRGMRLHISERAGQADVADAIIFRLDPQMSIADSEGYEIDVAPTRIMLSARDARGLFYAAVTLWDLCTSGPGRDDEIIFPAMRISDAPRFRWRGLLLDSARHYQTPESIMRLIDWMGLHKLNMLRWHLTDDQGWRLQIRKYPRLTSVGAWRVPAGPAAAADIDPGTGRPRLYGGFYSQDTVREIVAHAAERNVTIVPEIEAPAHATAAIVAYPELGVTDSPPSAVPSDWGQHPTLLSPQPLTLEFLESVLGEVLQLFPGELVSFGGYEAVKDRWQASRRIQARMLQLGIPNAAALQSYFTRPLQEYLRGKGRTLVTGDTVAEGSLGTLEFDTVQGEGRHEPPGRYPLIRLEDVYRFPGGATPRPEVLGLQGNIWTEFIRTSEAVESMTFPRAAALAEVGWSSPQAIDWGSFVRRLPSELDRYRALGIHYSEDVFAVRVGADLDREHERVHLSLSTQSGFGDIHYTLDGSEPSPAAALYTHPVDVPAQGEVRVAAFQGRHSLASTVVRALDVASLAQRSSHELEPCTRQRLLSLEDDAPVNSAEPRAVFLIDILNPCWKYTGADLSRVKAVQAAVGQVPFNFQIGPARQGIKLSSPSTEAGELEVRIDTCDGPPAAVLPLQPAIQNNEVTSLPPAPIPSHPGRHDLCFKFAQHQLDPLWAIDWVQLVE